MLRSLFNQQNHLGPSSPSGRWSMRIFQNWRRCSRFAAWTTTSSSLFSKTSRTSAKDWLSTRRRWLYSLRRSGSIFRRLFFVNATYIYRRPGRMWHPRPLCLLPPRMRDLSWMRESLMEDLMEGNPSFCCEISAPGRRDHRTEASGIRYSDEDPHSDHGLCHRQHWWLPQQVRRHDEMM